MSRAIRGIAFEGGGIAGISHVGAIRLLEKRGELKQLTHFAGSSAGSMVAALLACRVPVEKMEKILLKLDYNRLLDNSWGIFRDLFRLWNEFGWNTGEAIEEMFGELLEETTGDAKITYGQIQERYGSFLITTTTDVGSQETIYRSPDTTPDLQVRVGIRESSSIPLFFCPVKRDGEMFVDGGLLNNYPIRALYDYVDPSEVIGCKMYNSSQVLAGWKKKEPEVPSSLLGFAKTVVTMLHDLNLRAHVDDTDWSRTIKIDVGTVTATDFDINDECKRDLLNRGTQAAERFFLTRDE